MSCKIDVPSIVLLGNINPAIFHPAWLSSNHLITEKMQSDSRVQIISPQITVIQTPNFNINVTPQRLTVVAADATQLLAIRDLVVGIFTILEHTPLRSLGINRSMHFELLASQSFDAMQNALSKREPWEGLISSHKMRSITIEGKYADSTKATLSIRVEPSQSFQNGVFITLNEHHNSEDDNSAHYLTGVISSRWEAAQISERSIADAIINRCGFDSSNA